jgi:hypothetical protein
MTDTNSEKRAKMLEKVRLCLTLANDPGAEPGEAEAARQRADHLMTAYSIAQWEAETPDKPGERPKPEIRWVKIDWCYDTKDRDSAYALDDMFTRVYRHCRCVIAYRGQHTDGHGYREMPVVGLASDLDWADQLFTSLMLQIGRNLSPAVDPSGELGHQVYLQRQSGTDWPEITKRIYRAGLTTLTKGEFKKLAARAPDHFAGMEPEEVVWDDLKKFDWDLFGKGHAGESIKNRLANANRRYVKANGLQGERNYVRPEIYQRSFTEGFSREIRARLFKMSEEFRRTYDSDHGDGSMALVVQDIATQALVLYNQTWPEPPPVAVDPNYKPPKYRSVAIREKARSGVAAHAGAAEARKANLSNHASERIGGGRGALPE